MTQDDLNALYAPSAWPIPPGVAQTLSIIYTCYLYGAGMPVLIWLAFIYVFLAYWVEKVRFVWD
jgi:hypothetical protein